MKLIFSGVTRIVVLTKKYAIKFPKPFIWNHFLQGLLANMEEKMIWTVANIKGSELYDTKEYLCPIIWSSWGGWILVMQKLEQVKSENWKKNDFLEKVCSDHKPNNYGMLNGKQILLDYGDASRNWIRR